jgi:HAD superfamily hydrolase (TIGR01509 family)
VPSARTECLFVKKQARLTGKMNKGLFLDLDGTLADSIGVLQQVYFSFLTERGAEGSIEEFRRLNGLPLKTVIQRMKEIHCLSESSSELMATYHRLVREAHGSAPAAAEASTVLERAQARGWKVAIVTSSPRCLALAWIGRVGFDAYVDAVVGGDDVCFGKPSPEPYNVAVAKLGCTASQSLAVEDSLLGAQSALAAGLTTSVIADPEDGADWPQEVQIIGCFADIARSL